MSLKSNNKNDFLNIENFNNTVERERVEKISRRQKEFSYFLKSLRLCHGWSLRDLEEKTGISNAYLCQIEAGNRDVPTIKILLRLEQAYGIKRNAIIMEAIKCLSK